MLRTNEAGLELTAVFAPESQSNVSPAAIDLNEPGQRKLLARRIKEDIDAFCSDKYDDGPRSHLGASLIGHDCSRNLWYTFRWIKHKKHSGRQQRLFNRGHLEEFRFVEWLRGVGFQVWEYALDGSQHRVKAVRGHFGGSLDGISRLPERYNIAEAMLLEFKTSGTAPFAKLVKDGVKLAKPQHFAQMSMYGKHYKFKYALYMAINKNDDEIHVEIVELDWRLGEQLEVKAENIINSQEPPPKLAQSPAFRECKYCDYVGVCHNQEMISRNCRSCSKCFPVDNAEWYCTQYNANVPKEYLIKGCDNWNDITVKEQKHETALLSN